MRVMASGLIRFGLIVFIIFVLTILFGRRVSFDERMFISVCLSWVAASQSSVVPAYHARWGLAVALFLIGGIFPLVVMSTNPIGKAGELLVFSVIPLPAALSYSICAAEKGTKVKTAISAFVGILILMFLMNSVIKIKSVRIAFMKSDALIVIAAHCFAFLIAGIHFGIDYFSGLLKKGYPYHESD